MDNLSILTARHFSPTLTSGLLGAGGDAWPRDAKQAQTGRRQGQPPRSAAGGAAAHDAHAGQRRGGFSTNPVAFPWSAWGDAACGWRDPPKASKQHLQLFMIILLSSDPVER